MPSMIDPEKQKIAKQSKARHFRLCRKCGKKFRKREKCPRCGYKDYREVHRDSPPQRRS